MSKNQHEFGFHTRSVHAGSRPDPTARNRIRQSPWHRDRQRTNRRGTS